MVEIINPNEETRVSEGSKVDLHFSVAIENGVEIDNTRNREEPVSLVIGDGNLLPGFEKALFGLRAGDRRTVHLPLKMRLVLGTLKIFSVSIQLNLNSVQWLDT
jgi:FKBP-type peptidyl-prolyl cis-trans isomerase SlpA